MDGISKINLRCKVRFLLRLSTYAATTTKIKFILFQNYTSKGNLLAILPIEDSIQLYHMHILVVYLIISHTYSGTTG